MAKINLKSEILLNKKFKTELSGYNAKDVDEYLDLVILDYKYYEEQTELQNKIIGDKNDIIADAQEEIEKLKLEISVLKTQIKKAEESSNGTMKKDIEELKKKIHQF